MKKIIFIILIVSMTFVLTSCYNSEELTQSSENQYENIAYLYGELHGVPAIISKEFELWNNYYHENEMRHLFLEMPFYTAEYLNLWMKSNDDIILDEVFKDLVGTAMATQGEKDFFIDIKENCPETIFHGVDVGHQYNTTGARYLEYLTDNNMSDTTEYEITQEVIEQGKEFYSKRNATYRENMLTENFKREFDKLENQEIMGIFGGAHTKLVPTLTENVETMASQLIEIYGENIVIEDLIYIAKDIEPIRTEKIIINDIEYDAEYFGREDISHFSNDYSYRDFWKLDDAFGDFTSTKTSGEVLPYINFPMKLELNQIYVIDYTKPDSSVDRQVHRYEGMLWNGLESTQQIIIE